MHRTTFRIILLFFFVIPACEKGVKDLYVDRMDPVHFPPEIFQTKDSKCLQCHSDLMEKKVLARSPSGISSSGKLAWYQYTSTYEGSQMMFHSRHRDSPLSRQLMNLECRFCHRGNDPLPGEFSTSSKMRNPVLRKSVSAEKICLRCHGTFPFSIMGLPGDWGEIKDHYSGNCLTCHSTIRTNRHNVSYLNAGEIERKAMENPEVCYGCHGGRAWYRSSYPYPRNPWPGMPGMPEKTSDRAMPGPGKSEALFRILSQNRGDE